MRIVGLVIRAKPEHLDSVSRALTALPGVEIHGRDDDAGKLVVTVEDVPGAATTETLTQVQLVEHLICLTLAYEYSDHEPEGAATTAAPAATQPDTCEAAAHAG